HGRGHPQHPVPPHHLPAALEGWIGECTGAWGRASAPTTCSAPAVVSPTRLPLSHPPRSPPRPARPPPPAPGRRSSASPPPARPSVPAGKGLPTLPASNTIAARSRTRAPAGRWILTGGT